MAAAFGQDLGSTTFSVDGNTTTLTTSKTVTVGRTIVVAFIKDGTIDAYFPPVATDNLGNTYTLVETQTVGPYHACAMLSAPVTTGGTLTTITIVHQYAWAVTRSIIACEFSGVGALSSAGGGSYATSGTGTWVNSKTIPANGLAVGMVAPYASERAQTAGAASGSPSTTIVLGAESKVAGMRPIAILYAIAGGSDVTSFSGTSTFTSSEWVSAGATFSPSSGAGSANAITATATGTAVGPVMGRNYYIAPTGDDTTGTGTFLNPWRTMKKFYARPAQAGDTLYCRGGTYAYAYADYFTVSGISGTASAPITVRNYPGETPIFHGTGTTYTSSYIGRWNLGSSYHTFDGLTFENFRPDQSGVIYIGGNEGSPDPWCIGYTFRNCKFDMQALTQTNTAHAIYAACKSQDILVEDCLFIGTYPDDLITGAGFQTEHGPCGVNFLVQRCIFDSWQDAIQLYGDIAPRASGSILHCTFVNNARHMEVRYHGAITIRDNAGHTALSGSWANIEDVGGYSGLTTADHNFWGQTFQAGTYYLAPGQTGRKAASDGLDAGALNDAQSDHAGAQSATATGTANDSSITAVGGAPALTGTATGTAYNASATLGASAGTATATATAVDPPNRSASAGLPAASAIARNATVTVTASPGRTDVSAAVAQATGTASGASPLVSAGAVTAVGIASALAANPPSPPSWAGSAEYVIELFSSDTTFGPATKVAEVWDARNLGWSRYDRLPGRGFFTLYQDSPHLSSIIPIITHVRVTRVASAGNVEVFNGIVSDYNSTGDDVVFDIYDYVSLLSLSRSGYRTLYPTKLIGTEIVSAEWALAKSATNSPLGFVATGTIQNPLGSDNLTAIKTNAQFGLMDQMRLALFYDLTEMGRANTINQVTYEITRTAPFTFNFWKNKGNVRSIPLVLNGTVSDYQFAPNWGQYRNDLATLGTTLTGGATEVVKTNTASAAVFGRRQDVFSIKTLAGTGALTVESDQQQAVAERMLKTATEGTPSLWLTLVSGAIPPFSGWDICDTFPVEIVNGTDSITGNWRVVGVRAIMPEEGERLQVLVAKVLT